MTGKITAAVVAAILVASAGVASAKASKHWAQTSVQAPYSDSYYDRDYWNGVAPAGRIQLHDPNAGTYWEGVAPY
jgi:hypothetical protein